MILSLPQNKRHPALGGGALQQTASLHNQEPEFEVKEAETKHPRANTGRMLESLRVSTPSINHSKPHQEEEAVGLTPTGVQRPETRSLACLIPRPDRGRQPTDGCGPPSRCAH
jgi:hypothetical protein